MILRRLAMVTVLLIAGALPSRALKVYMVGNSITDCVDYALFDSFAKARNITPVTARDVVLGAPLWLIWNTPDGFVTDPYGTYPNAFANYTWDAVTLQAGCRLRDPDYPHESDSMMVCNFISLAAQKSPNCTFYIYAHWPARDGTPAINNADQWDQVWHHAYTDLTSYDYTSSGPFYDTLLHHVRKALPQRKIFIIPTGDVVSEINQRAKNGQIAGMSSALDLYADGVHANNKGSYAICCSFFATIYHDNLANLPDGTVDATMAATFRAAAWKVVSTHPYSGVGGTGATRPVLTGAQRSAAFSRMLVSLDGSLQRKTPGSAVPLFEVKSGTSSGGVLLRR